MELNIRKLKQGDLTFIKKWWEAWPEWTAPADDFLPNTGVIVESNNKPVFAGFIYLTNAKVALVEWIVSDPEYKDNRKKALELLITGAEDIIKELGYKYSFSICRHKNLIETHKKLGWVVDDKPSHELVKILK